MTDKEKAMRIGGYIGSCIVLGGGPTHGLPALLPGSRVALSGQVIKPSSCDYVVCYPNSTPE